MDSNQKVNPNLAGRAALMNLPGVGEAVADRIIAARPYVDAEDLLRVSGIGPRSLARIREALFFEDDNRDTAGSDAPHEVLRESASRTSTASKAGAVDTGLSDFITRERALWLILGGGVLSVVVAVILSLAILAGINGTLSVERQASIRQLRVQAEVVTTQLDGLTADLESLRSRLQAVEGLSGRMSVLEDEAQLLRDEMDLTITEMGRVQSMVSTLSDQVGAMEGSVNMFDQFLQGVRTLMGQIFPAPAPEVTQ